MSVLLLVAILVVTPRVLSLLYGDANDVKVRKTELPQVNEEVHANPADTITTTCKHISDDDLRLLPGY